MSSDSYSQKRAAHHPQNYTPRLLFSLGDKLDDCAIALGYGSMYNHELNPNANFILDLENMTIDIEAIQDIAAGEEITLNYHGEPGDESEVWF
jgi:SET domain-containing protein